jgi:hypothetical protein
MLLIHLARNRAFFRTPFHPPHKAYKLIRALAPEKRLLGMLIQKPALCQGHDFSRAETGRKTKGFSPCVAEISFAKPFLKQALRRLLTRAN